MDEATVGIAMDALKESAIDLVVTLPEEPTHALPEATQKDPYFTTVIAAGEGNGLAVCGGAALSGRDCVFVTGVAGLLVGTWAALATDRLPRRLRAASEALFHLPLAVPSVVLGFGLLVAFSRGTSSVHANSRTRATWRSGGVVSAEAGARMREVISGARVASQSAAAMASTSSRATRS